MLKNSITRRINIIFCFLLLLGGLIVGRLFFLQIISREYYSSLAERQHVFSKVLTPRRGDISMQNKKGRLITVATTKEGFGIYVNPKILQKNQAARAPDYLESVYRQVVDIIDIDKNHFLSRIAKIDDPFETLTHNAERDDALRVQALNIEGIGVVPEEWRFYPADTVASHVIGFVGHNGDALEGRYGIEQYFEDILQGERGFIEGEMSAGGFLLDIGRKIFHSPKEGNDIVLTLNIDIQLFLENALLELMEKWHAEGAGGIVIEPKTGRILALGALPHFNLNAYGAVEDLTIFINPLIGNVYELGSVFKPLTLAASLDKGRITPETTYVDQGYLLFNEKRIENYDGKGRGRVTMQRVLEESLNTGAVFAMQQLGKNDFYNYMINYGLDSKTDIELPGEVVGNLSNLDTFRDIEYATASYGQGIAVTGIAAVRAFSALANGGLLMKPYIVDRIIKPGKPDSVTKPKIQSRVLQQETSETMSRMLVQVVDNALLGGTIKNPHYTIAVKTGTALLPQKSASGYSDNLLHSFFGYGPAFDARFLVFLYLEKPQEVRYASESLGKPFMDIMRFLFNYYDVPPDR